jgi:hypothetical protein
MMTPQLEEALEWVNHMRTGPLQGPPIDELPKGVPGHTLECVFARALKLGIMPALKVQVNNASHMIHVEGGQALIQGGNPSAVRKMIEQFDAGNLRHLIDYEAYRKLSPSGGSIVAAQALAKPFDKLMPQLAKFCPELKLSHHSHVEVSQSFDTQLHVVTVKNPGECPQSLELTATMVRHMQKVMEEEMQKALYPPMVYDAGKLEALKPGSIIKMWDPVEFTPAKSLYYAPDWAKMMQQTPEAPVKAPSEELTVV